MKLDQFRRYLAKNRIDFAIFLNTGPMKKDPCLLYFAETDVDCGCLVIPQKARPFLLIPGFDYYRIKKISKLKVLLSRKGLFATLKKRFPKAKKIGINANYFSIAENKKLRKHFKCRTKDISQAVAKLRVVKTKEEIAIIKKACRITDRIMQKFMAAARRKKFRTEKQILLFIESEIKKAGCSFSFDPIIASGKNAYFPHHLAKDELNKGFCIVDFGIKYKNYCTDITRTIYFGKPSQREVELYNKVLEAQKAAITTLRAGADFKKPETAARKTLGAHKKHFIHAIGHSLGIEIHDTIPAKQASYLSGMVVTIEPGIYIKNKLGIRIEDDLLVTEKGAEILTRTTKKLITIPKQ